MEPKTIAVNPNKILTNLYQSMKNGEFCDITLIAALDNTRYAQLSLTNTAF